MGDASNLQTSFLGGEWSPNAQGRAEHPQYKIAMASSLNGYPVEEGAWARRPGFAFAAPTRNGAPGRVLPFDFTDTSPYSVELTTSHARVFAGRGLVFTPDAATIVDISSDSPAVVTVSAPVSWSTGDQGQVLFQTVASIVDGAVLRNRQFAITMIGTTQFSLADPVSGAPVSGVTWNGETDTAQFARILDLPTPYAAADWPAVRAIQAAEVGPGQTDVLLMLQGKHPPQSILALPNPGGLNVAPFSIAQQDFADGPYLNVVNGSQVTPDAVGPIVNLTLAFAQWSTTVAYTLNNNVTQGTTDYQCIVESSLNEAPSTHPASWKVVAPGSAVSPNGFVSTDVGRHMRFLSEPALWAIGTSYILGDAVKWNNGYYVCTTAGAGFQPDLEVTAWLPSASQTVFTWTWGKITAINTPNSVQVTLLGPNLLYGSTVFTWRLGIYSDTTGWPTCGCFDQGRLWLAGAGLNRIDSSNSNDFYNMAPTGPDGTVGDANSITAVANGPGDNTILWIEVTDGGVVAGTKSGHWLVFSSLNQDQLTPSSIDFKRVTKTGCLGILPVHTPLTLVFVQAQGRQMYELFPNIFGGKITVPNLNVFAKHLTTSGIAEMAYQTELTPIVWARCNDGSLIGGTYRRVSQYGSEDPKFFGAHRHALGSGRLVESLCVTPTPDETLEMLQIVTNDPNTGIRHVEMSTPLFDTNDPLTTAFFVDDGVTPSGMSTSATGVTFFGLWHLNGQTVSVMVGGLDLGDYPITNGQVSVPFGADEGGFFTLTYLQALAASGINFGDLAATLEQSITNTPAKTPNLNGVISMFPLPATGVTGTGNWGVTDWRNLKFYLGGSGGIRRISLLNNREEAEVSAAALGAYTPDQPLNSAAVDNAGNIYYYSGDSSNSGPLSKVNGLTLATVAQATINAPARMTTTAVGGVTFLTYLELQANNHKLHVINATTMVDTTYNNQPAENYGGELCGGPNGLVYAFGNTVGGNQVTLYATQISGPLLAQIATAVRGTLNAASIDPSWTKSLAISSVGLDQADGNLIIGVGGNNAGSNATNTAYMAKIRAADASVIWKIAVAGQPPAPLDQSRIAGFYAYLAAPNATLYMIDTIGGVLTTFQFSGLSAINGNFGNANQYFDSNTGRLTAMGSYINGGGTPTPGTGTPGSFDNQFFNYLNGTLFAAATTSVNRYTIPAVLGFTFKSQGQLLRALTPQEAGAQNGPALGKTRRTHMYGLLISAAITGAVSIGTLFTKLRTITFKTTNQTPLATNALFSGVNWGTLDDDYSFDSQLCWQVTRPFPLTIAAAGSFLNTQDR